MTIEQDAPMLRVYIRTAGDFAYHEALHHHSPNRADEVVISATSPNVEVPVGSSATLERLMHLTSEGIVFYLTRNGERITGLGPAALVESALLWPGDLDDADDAEIRVVQDTSTLIGPGVPDFDSWFAAVMTDRHPA